LKPTFNGLFGGKALLWVSIERNLEEGKDTQQLGTHHSNSCARRLQLTTEIPETKKMTSQ
jgi:hypothetical protein